MRIAVDISMYPLHQDYEPPIIRFIHRLRGMSDLVIHTNQLSTQISGEYDTVMQALQEAMRPELNDSTSVSFVIKILNVDIEPGQTATLA